MADVSDARREFPKLEEVRATLTEIVAASRRADGTMPDLVMLTLDKAQMRHLYAADRYLDELDIIREGKKQYAASQRRPAKK